MLLSVIAVLAGSLGGIVGAGIGLWFAARMRGRWQ